MSGNGSEPAAALQGEAVRSGIRHDPDRVDQVRLIERAEEVARISRDVCGEDPTPDDARLALEAATTTAGGVAITNGRIVDMGPKWVRATLNALDVMQGDYGGGVEEQAHDPPDDGS